MDETVSIGEANFPECNNFLFIEFPQFNILPEELKVHVLEYVSSTDLIWKCSLVSKQMLILSRSPALWRRKCIHKRRYMPGVIEQNPINFMHLYINNPYARNLLKNTHACKCNYIGLTHMNIFSKSCVKYLCNHYYCRYMSQ